MDTEAIERRALEVLTTCPRYLWNPQEPPVPVEKIADSCFGLLVQDKPPAEMLSVFGAPELGADQSISGLLLPSLGRIWVNADEARDWPTRRRFTICHELGHHILHRTGRQSLFCRHTSVDEEQEPDAPRPELAPEEHEANAFAAALLLPAPWIRHYYRDTGGDFDALCRTFNCSGGAMGRRLHAVIK